MTHDIHDVGTLRLKPLQHDDGHQVPSRSARPPLSTTRACLHVVLVAVAAAPAVVAVLVQSHLIVRCPSLQRSTHCQIARVVRMLMAVGRCAQLVDGVQLGGRRRSQVHLATPPSAVPLDESGHYVPRSVHPPYWATATRGGSQGYKTE